MQTLVQIPKIITRDDFNSSKAALPSNTFLFSLSDHLIYTEYSFHEICKNIISHCLY